MVVWPTIFFKLRKDVNKLTYRVEKKNVIIISEAECHIRPALDEICRALYNTIRRSRDGRYQ